MRATLLAAIVTPLRDEGATLDEEAIGPLVEYVEAEGHCDGLFIAGTTGEGFLLEQSERELAVSAFCAASKGRCLVHAGARTTAETVRLCEQAVEAGADGVAVISPPYFPFGEKAIIEHLVAAGKACAPTPFFVYVFGPRSGYKLDVSVVEAVGERIDNLAGMKVSEPTIEEVAPFLELGLEVLVGADGVIPQALAAGAAGSASALAGVDPAAVRRVLDAPGAEGARNLERLRKELVGGEEMIPALKAALRRRGVPIRGDVRLPLRVASANNWS